MVVGSNFPFKVPDKYIPTKEFHFSASSPEHTGRFHFGKDGYINPPYNVNKNGVYGVYIVYLID